MTTNGALEELTYDECLALLRRTTVGRVACMIEGGPVILPVNYRLLESSGPTWIVLRTRPDNVLDQPETRVAFEVDEIDLTQQEGSSVLVRGTMHRVDPAAADLAERFDPEPWADGRDAWLAIEPFSITGRRVHGARPAWPFVPHAYL